MINVPRILVTGILLLCTAYITNVTQAAELNITIHNVKETKGSVRIAFWNKADLFPKAKKSLKVLYPGEQYVKGKAVTTKDKIPGVSIKAEQGSVSFSIDLPAGEYAFAAFQDLNQNEKMDTVFLIGLPKEPYCASRDAKGKFGPPSYDNAKFSIKENSPNKESCSLIPPN